MDAEWWLKFIAGFAVGVVIMALVLYAAKN